MLCDVVIRAAGMASNAYIQSPATMLERAHRLLNAAIMASPVMRGFLGYGAPAGDILSGGTLDE